MIIALIIVSVLFLSSLGIIFLLWKVLKNTFNNLEKLNAIVKDMLDIQAEEYELETAYNDKYYFCDLLLLSVEFEAPHTEIAADFSLYDSKKIAGLHIKTKDSFEDYFDEDRHEEMQLHFNDIENNKECNIIVPKAVLYEPIEGVWSWKLQS